MQEVTTLGKLAPALVAAQKELQHPKRRSENPHLRNKFADLSEVIDTVRPVLNKHGLAFTQTLGYTDHEGKPWLTLTTRLLHESGESITDVSALPIEPQKGLNLGQVTGLLSTFLRRYGISAITGVASEPDDDGNERKPSGSSGSNKKTAPPADPTPPKSGPQTTEAVILKDFKTDKITNKKGGKFTVWMIQASDGNEYRTTNRNLGTEAEALILSKARVELTYEDTGRFGLGLKGIEVLPSTPPSRPPPPAQPARPKTDPNDDEPGPDDMSEPGEPEPEGFWENDKEAA